MSLLILAIATMAAILDGWSRRVIGYASAPFTRASRMMDACPGRVAQSSLDASKPVLAIECIHKQLSHIPSTLATRSQKSRRNVLDVNADAVPGQRARRVDRGDRQL